MLSFLQTHFSSPTYKQLTSTQNIAKAQAEIDRLEAADPATEHAEKSHDSAKKPSLANSSAVTNGKPSAEATLKQEENGVDDASQDLEAVKLEDS